MKLQRRKKTTRRCTAYQKEKGIVVVRCEFVDESGKNQLVSFEELNLVVFAVFRLVVKEQLHSLTC